MKRKRRTRSPSFKAKVALAAIKGDRSLPEMAVQQAVGQIQTYRTRPVDVLRNVQSYQETGHSSVMFK